MVISEVTPEKLADYLRIMPEDLTKEERITLADFLIATKAYIKSYTGLSDADMEAKPDLAIATLCLAGDMYTNRDRYKERSGTGQATPNQTVETILGMYSVNLL